MLRVLLAALLLAACGDPEPTTPATPSPTPGAVESPSPAAPTPRPGVQVTDVPVKSAKPPTKKKNRWLGLSVANMTDPIPGAPEDRRGVVSRAFRGGPAHTAGLKRGDVLLQAAGREVLKYQDYIAEARNVEVGDALSLRVLRDGRELDVSVAMIEKPRDIHRWKVEHWKDTPMLPYEADLVRPVGQVRSAESEGKVRVLYFWATWCGPCRTTSPMVEKMHTEWGDAAEVLAISSEERGTIEKYITTSTTTYPLVHDSRGHLKLDYEVKKLPTIVVIGADGRVVSWATSVSGVRRAAETVRGLLAP